jgi:hypothetical protein
VTPRTVTTDMSPAQKSHYLNNPVFDVCRIRETYTVYVFIRGVLEWVRIHQVVWKVWILPNSLRFCHFTHIFLCTEIRNKYANYFHSLSCFNKMLNFMKISQDFQTYVQNKNYKTYIDYMMKIASTKMNSETATVKLLQYMHC